MTYEEAAAAPGATAPLYFLRDIAKIQRGQKILINGASGCFGTYAVQLAKYYGAEVTGVCGSNNLKLVKSLGADIVIDYRAEDFTCDDQKYSFVFDTVGKSSFFKCRQLLDRGGVYISSDLGYMYQNIFLPLITPIIKPMIGNKKTVSPIPSDLRGSLLLIKKLIEGGKFKAVIDRKFPLEQIVEAYRYVEKGQKVGNVVITVEQHNEVQSIE